MRTFSSYGPVDKELHYYVPREELIQKACHQLIGENPEKGGHYITVWAPRQTGKSWVMQEVFEKIRQDGRFETGMFSFQSAKTIDTDEKILRFLVKCLKKKFSKNLPDIDSWEEFADLFGKPYFEKPVILILDEFDALNEDFVNKFANQFRDIYISRQIGNHKLSDEKDCLLHSVALIGVRAVLGVENVKGSPFNVQRSMHIPNLTYEEVNAMFRWYETESNQKVEQDVIDRIFYETQGQPGLVSWFGELLTQTYNEKKHEPITTKHFSHVFKMAVRALPNNNILNIISKAKQKPYKETVLELFRTGEKTEFAFDDPNLNFLYMNGVIDTELSEDNLYVKFSNPFLQKRLFNYFSRELFQHMGTIYEPFEDVSDIVTETSLNIKNLMRRYEIHLQNNRHWMLKDAPRRSDLKIYEAVFHFNLYEYLVRFFGSYDTKIFPEFPTGNGKVDILIRHGGNLYAVELKSYKDKPAYEQALKQAARYGKTLNLNTIHLVVFVEYIPDEYRLKYETKYIDKETDVTVETVFVATGK